MSAAPNFVSIPFEDLLGAGAVEFDVYVQPNAKHVLCLRKGAEFDQARADKMGEKNVRHLFIQSSDEGSFRAIHERRLEAAYDPSSTMSIEARSALIQRARVQAVEALIKDLSSIPNYTIALENAKRLTEFVMKEEKSLKAIITQPNPQKSIAAHGVSVAAIALALAKKLGHGGMKDLHLLTLGCTLHDVGHEVGGTAVGAALEKLTGDALKVHREHPLAGARKAQDLVHFDQHVLKIILQHEECIDGSGYPKKTLEKEMHLFPLLAQTANAYDRLITFEGETPQSAVKRFVIDRIGQHPLAHFNAIKSIAKEL